MVDCWVIHHSPLDFHGAVGRGRLPWMALSAPSMTIFFKQMSMVDCWIIHNPPLDFHGAGGRGRLPWLCKHAPMSRTGTDGPQAEEITIAADAHRIARVPCDEFLLFCFSRRGSEKKHGLSGCKKKVPPIICSAFVVYLTLRFSPC
jgi:hypothetical protein